MCTNINKVSHNVVYMISRLIYLKDFWIDCLEIIHRNSWSPEDETSDL